MNQRKNEQPKSYFENFHLDIYISQHLFFFFSPQNKDVQSPGCSDYQVQISQCTSASLGALVFFLGQKAQVSEIPQPDFSLIRPPFFEKNNPFCTCEVFGKHSLSTLMRYGGRTEPQNYNHTSSTCRFKCPKTRSCLSARYENQANLSYSNTTKSV